VNTPVGVYTLLGKPKKIKAIKFGVYAPPLLFLVVWMFLVHNLRSTRSLITTSLWTASVPLSLHAQTPSSSPVVVYTCRLERLQSAYEYIRISFQGCQSRSRPPLTKLNTIGRIKLQKYRNWQYKSVTHKEM
jgi:hypothetical protein